MNNEEIMNISKAHMMTFNDLNTALTYYTNNIPTYYTNNKSTYYTNNKSTYYTNDYNSMYKISDFQIFYNNFPKISDIKFFYAKDIRFADDTIRGCIIKFSDGTFTRVVLNKNIDFSLIKDFDIKSILVDMCIFKRVLFNTNTNKSFCNKFTEKLVKDYNRKCAEEKKKKDYEDFQKAARLHRHQKKLLKKRFKQK